ncbi:hypothetical protein [Prevotella melaninogenica]|nr:hypothetical protein [Prevotella melaninogenica]QUB66045.1 hypothetical protein J5A57_02825 [Prevotella melaninogenica]
MMYKLRDYQQKASDTAVAFLMIIRLKQQYDSMPDRLDRKQVRTLLKAHN